jgi:hypothetical protein
MVVSSLSVSLRRRLGRSPCDKYIRFTIRFFSRDEPARPSAPAEIQRLTAARPIDARGSYLSALSGPRSRNDGAAAWQRRDQPVLPRSEARPLLLQAPRIDRSRRGFRTSRGTQGVSRKKGPVCQDGTNANRQGAWRRGMPSRGRPIALGCSVGAVSVLPSGRWALATWRLDQYCRGGHRAQSLTPLSIRMRMGGDLARLCLDSSSARVRVWVAVGWHELKTLSTTKRFAPLRSKMSVGPARGCVCRWWQEGLFVSPALQGWGGDGGLRRSGALAPPRCIAGTTKGLKAQCFFPPPCPQP